MKVPTVLGLLLFAAVAAWMIRGVGEAAQVSDREGLARAAMVPAPVWRRLMAPPTFPPR